MGSFLEKPRLIGREERTQEHGEKGDHDKSRDQGATVITMAFLTWAILYWPRFTALVVSRKGELVDGGEHEEDSLFGKVDYMIKNIPDWMVDRPTIKRRHKPSSIVYARLGTRMAGETSGKDVGQSFRTTMTFVDEAARFPYGDHLMKSIETVSVGKVLASTPNGLTLSVTDTETDNPHIGVEQGAPLYYSWSGDGNSLAVHIGEEIKLFRTLSEPVSGEVLSTARGFRVPAFSPDGQWLAYVNQTESGSALFVVRVDDLDHPTRLTEVGAFSAFMWSPTGEELAVADQTDSNTVAFERLRVVSAGSAEESTVAEETLLAFYWSPDGRRIAWVSLEREQQTFEWKVASIGPGAVGDSRSLFNFHPSREVFTMLSFFDQYAYSHSPWSPDSSHLVVAGTERMPFERRNGHTPTGARVFVLDVETNILPQDISEGTLAFWSWN